MTLGGVGQTVAGRYRLEEFLGRGGYGEVWRAWDIHRSHRVALKFLLSRDRGGAWHEASLLTALKSPYILEVNNADLVVDVSYLDTALAQTTLQKESEPYGVEPSVAVDWMRKALRGLDLCHRRGLLHRDVKPDNVFMNKPGEIKLGDFGIAAVMDAAGGADPGGDPRICAPEFFDGGRATVGSDIYAAAATLYAVLAGRLPYSHCTQMDELRAAILAEDYPDLRDVAPHVSTALAQRVKQGMASAPNARFASAAAFDSALSLPQRDRHFMPAPPHSGHARCWSVTGKGADLDVCVIATGPSWSIETRRTGGSRVRRHCLECADKELSKRLRAVFNSLR